MEYGNTPYVGMALDKNGGPVKCVQNHVQNSALIIGIGLFEPYYDISSVFISNKTVSGARKHCQSTRPASRYTGWERPNGLSLLCFFLSFISHASTLLAEAVTMI